MIEPSKKSAKINIIPLIDIIFLMLVFFMLATNFSKKKEISFSIQEKIEETSDFQKNLKINISDNKFLILGKETRVEKMENEIIKLWQTGQFKNIIILNDDTSSLQQLIYILDFLKKNKIKNVTFADDPKLQTK
jgi:biopolymer transport protein ExbD